MICLNCRCSACYDARPAIWTQTEMPTALEKENAVLKARVAELEARLPKPAEGVGYVNVFASASLEVFRCKDDAEACGGPNRIACVKFTWVEGQFDE